MLAALALILGLASYYLPVVGAVLLLVTPLPAALAAVRYGTRVAVMTSVAATLIAFTVGDPLAALFVLSSCLMGAALGHGMARSWKVSATMFLGAVTFAASLGLTIVVAVQIMGPAGSAGIGESATIGFEGLAAAARALGRTADAETLERAAQMIRAHILAAVALAAIPGGFVWAFVWYGTCSPVLRRLGHAVPPPGAPAPVARWSLPPVAGMVLLGVLLVTILASPLFAPDSFGLFAAQIVLQWVSLAFVFQGVGLAAYLVTGLGLEAPLRRLLIFALFPGAVALPPLAQVLVFAGMFDVGFRYRARAAAPGRRGPEGPRGALGRPGARGPDVPGEEFRRGESVQSGPAPEAGEDMRREKDR